MNSQSLEELYLEAEADIKNNDYAEAFKKYESILYEEPNNGPTLNSLGWLYKTQIEDYIKAESYYKACIKSNPLYPHSYYNYATLLTDMERFEELSDHLQSCFRIATIEKSWVYMKLGLMEELKLNFDKAKEYHEKSILVALSDEKIKGYQQNIDRCKLKIQIAETHASWLIKIR
jgi:tetratricopeptide (TPR) repeat protein